MHIITIKKKSLFRNTENLPRYTTVKNPYRDSPLWEIHDFRNVTGRFDKKRHSRRSHYRMRYYLLLDEVQEIAGWEKQHFSFIQKSIMAMPTSMESPFLPIYESLKL
jgi:hypothetical protein